MGFCTETREIWVLVGNLLNIFKIVIPIILVIWGMIDMGKAVVGSKDDEIKKAAKSLMMRIIAGVIIFFIPTLVGFVFSIVDGFNGDIESDWSVCNECLTNPGDC